MKKLLLILVILVGFILLSGCCCNFCGGYITPPQPKANLTVVANSWDVYGLIVIDGNSTGEYIYPYQSITIYDLPCNQTVEVYIVDNCGYVSHKEFPFLRQGANYVYFDYWGPYGVYKEQQKGQNDFRQNDCYCKS